MNPRNCPKEISLPLRYRFAGVHAGIKPNSTKLDVALIVSDLPAVAAGVYTQNLVCGAPVQIDRRRTPGTGFRVVVVNSGVANACTGAKGVANAEQMATLAAATVEAAGETGLVLSTGVIGIQLPMEKISSGIAHAGSELSPDFAGFFNAARAMMTTDTVEKIGSRQFSLADGQRVTLAGMAKGAAMIGPNMATMLVVLMTDAALPPETAQAILRRVTDPTFNSISVEGHTSTSDTVILLANGAAMLNRPPLSTEELEIFETTLMQLCFDLARMIPNDGEGVSHLITIHVGGCRTITDARQIARTVANDALVKTAICGADPNWGRIISAAGRAGVPFDPNGVSLAVNGFRLYADGSPLPFDKTEVSTSIRTHRETTFEISFAEGDESTCFWTSDLTAEYVRLNADYTT